LLDVLPAESSAGWRPDDLERWRQTLAAARTAAARTEPRLSGAADPSPAGFLAALRRALPPDGVLVTDSGLHQQLARRHFQVLRPRTLLVPADFQSMGFGLPAAIGASLAEPERPVVALVGDGGVAISGLELLTAVREGVGLTVVVFNDGRLNLIRLQQLLRFGREHGVTHRAPDLEALARAVGARYLRLEGEPDRALSDSIGSGELWLLEVVVEDTVWLRRLGALGSVRRLVRSRQG
jgi:acetolactate synthase-1/2/3 large subunit